jgi:hypothetical protein
LKHGNNTYFNKGHDIPVGGFVDPNGEPGFSKEDPKLKGGIGTDYLTWMATAEPLERATVKDRGVRRP